MAGTLSAIPKEGACLRTSKREDVGLSEEWERRREEKIEEASGKRKTYGERFWDRKTRLTYYLISVPFAVAGVAIASYPYAPQAPVILVVLEVLSWVALVLSGYLGVRARWGEMEQARIQSVSASGQMQRFRSARSQDEAYSAKWSELSQNHQERLLQAEKMESIGVRGHKILLWTCFGLWVLARSSFVLLAVK